MEIRGSHRQSSDTLHARPARDRIIRRAEEIPSIAAERFESSCFSLGPLRIRTTDFATRHWPGNKLDLNAASRRLVTPPTFSPAQFGWHRLMLDFRVRTYRQGFAQLSGGDDPAHYFAFRHFGISLTNII